MKLSQLLIFSFLSFSLFAQDDIEIYESFDQFEEAILHRDDGYTYVVNYWATWCGPCVKELPYFQNIEKRFPDSKIKVVLVSLDFEKQIDSKLKPFLKKNEITHEVVVLLDGDVNRWIDLVDKNWSGSIPYTTVYKGKKKIGIEKSFHNENELDEFIKSL